MDSIKGLLIFSMLFVVSQSLFAKNKFYVHRTPFHIEYPQVRTQASTSLLYYGGPVISHPKVFTVLWNDRVSAEVKAHISEFYAAYVNSEHMDWLNEYQTNLKAVDGRPGTAQEIGRGQFLGEKLIAASVSSKKITDVQIQHEIELQIDAGVLPRPDQDSLYMIHFSKDIQISVEGMTSCYAFGGYHNGFKSAKYGNVFYGVLPECSFLGSGGFSELTQVSAHELIEAVTDPFPTPGNSPAYPQAWNAADGNEIADICSSGSATLKGPKANYSISLEWSNSRKRCYDGQ